MDEWKTLVGIDAARVRAVARTLSCGLLLSSPRRFVNKFDGTITVILLYGFTYCLKLALCVCFTVHYSNNYVLATAKVLAAAALRTKEYITCSVCK